ncbi:MAG: DUF459 domain-containing protein, partial [Hyphomicrobiales bacterium]|nr:DUF459 domain-containing protein [Hyphomicrobiales bacterium]
ARRPAGLFVPTTATRAPGAAGGPPAAPTFHALVVGDDFGQELSAGLSAALADRPEAAVVDRARGTSGLVRADFYDWNKAGAALATGPDPFDVVLVMIGSNDAQAIVEAGKAEAPFSDAWNTLYKARIDAFLAPFRKVGKPIVWVGLPPPRAKAYAAALLQVNGLQRAEATLDGAQYVDVWDAYLDPSGAYSDFGPDIQGQNARLRTADGVHLTAAGERKLASFVETRVRSLLQGAAPKTDVVALPPDVQAAASDINAEILKDAGAPAPKAAPTPPAAPALDLRYAYAPPRMGPGPIQSLEAYPQAKDGALVSAVDPWAGPSGAVLTRVVVDGAPLMPTPGRADYFPAPKP